MPKIRLPRLPRLTGWALIAVALVAVTWLLEPTRLPAVVAKLANISLAAVVAYWIDRRIFCYARPDSYLVPGGVLTACEALFVAACHRRALIVCAAMLAMALGV